MICSFFTKSSIEIPNDLYGNMLPKRYRNRVSSVDQPASLYLNNSYNWNLYRFRLPCEFIRFLFTFFGKYTHTNTKKKRIETKAKFKCWRCANGSMITRSFNAFSTRISSYLSLAHMLVLKCCEKYVISRTNSKWLKWREKLKLNAIKGLIETTSLRYQTSFCHSNNISQTVCFTFFF